MNKLFTIVLFLIIQIIFLTTGKKIYDKRFYIGAVVEYANIYDETKFPEENIQRNINEYAKFIRSAKEQAADIIVFPEYGLTSVNIVQNRPLSILYSSEIPNPKDQINPCEESKVKNNKNRILPIWSEILTQISCEAKNNKIYVVVNLGERVKSKNNWLLYNTNIVFDRSGILISRYRKYNLYKEPAFNITDRPEFESFTTDFDVTFGTMTCFDILYADPTLFLIKNKGVTDLLFPTAWMSKMPFLTAIQTQAGFVKAYEVNLLASNYDNPHKYGGGSGIYSPFSGILNYTIPDIKQSKMIVANIPKLQFNKKKYGNKYKHFEKKKYYNNKNVYLETLTENWDGFTTQILESNINNHTICNAQLCCNFTIKSTIGNFDYFYRLVVTDSYRSSERDRHHVQICGIVACLNQNIESCGHRLKNTRNPKLFEIFKITGNFNMNDQYVHIPSIVNYNLSTLPFNSYSYDTKKYEKHNTIKLKIKKPVDKILGISIYGRARA